MKNSQNFLCNWFENTLLILRTISAVYNKSCSLFPIEFGTVLSKGRWMLVQSSKFIEILFKEGLIVMDSATVGNVDASKMLLSIFESTSTSKCMFGNIIAC